MSKPKLEDLYTVEYRGINITVQRRLSSRFFGTDYGYKTSSGISGIGQRSTIQVETDARDAIDKAMSDDRTR